MANQIGRGSLKECYADISRISALGYSPRVTFEQGLSDLVEWVRLQKAEDRVEEAAAELERRGLVS